ncbi:MAG: VanZ family protein [Candidatus Omnitrophota bacterium]|nr:VanZ family protein [Candidatus Omnitrophota bacterium]
MRYRSKIIVDWTIASVFFALVLLTLFLPGRLKLYSIAHDADFVIKVLMWVLFGSTFMILLIYLFLKRKKGRAEISAYIWFIGIFLTCFLVLSMVEKAWDRLHFLEYGILSLLLFRALRHSITTQMLYFWVSVVIFFCAFLDETLQLFVMNRSFELRDLGLDCLSGLAGGLIIALVVRPELRTASFKLRKYANELKKGERFVKGQSR